MEIAALFFDTLCPKCPSPALGQRLMLLAHRADGL
jgi:hypothetical protein